MLLHLSGWYTDRVTHIHLEIFVNPVLKLTTQLAYPNAVPTAVYSNSVSVLSI
ncbi:MAG TPA: hypothetical protein VMH27_01300 [Puia sp.]|nr:hypothetical protein [Puia sp.]